VAFLMHPLRALMRLLLIFSCVWLALVSQPVHGQSVLRGVVSDSLTGDPLPGANVVIAGTAVGVATDREGTYRIGGLAEGAHTVRISFLGYQTKDVPVTLGPSETRTLDI